MAYIRKHGTGYQAQLHFEGRNYYATRSTKREAQAWAMAKEQELESQKSHPRRLLSIKEAFEKYINEVCLDHRGARWEELRLRKIARELPDKDFADLTVAEMSAYMNMRQRKVKAGTVRREHSLLNQVFNKALYEWEMIKKNPLKPIKAPAKPKGRARGIAQAEIDQMLQALGYSEGIIAERRLDEVAIAWLLGIESAMRAGEIFTLGWDQVYLKDQYVQLFLTKNGDDREVPLSTRAVELFGCLPRVGEYCFTVKKETASTLFTRYRKKAGIKDLTFHDSRGEGITRMSKKLEILDLARFVGHRDLKSLMIYYSTNVSAAARKLD